MLSCKEVTRMVASDEVGGAGWRRRLVIRFHLLSCRHCRRYTAQMRAIGQSARKIFGLMQEEPEAINRLEHAILQSISGEPTDSTGGKKDPKDSPSHPGEPDPE